MSAPPATGSLAILGSLNMDFVVSVERLPQPGETVLGHGFQMVPGGKGANQACAAGKLAGTGRTVRMFGRVGLDPFADHLKASLSAAGVDVSGVASLRQHPTGTAFIWVDAAGQNSIVVAAGANAQFQARDVAALRPSFRNASHALFQLETPLETVAAALALARAEGATTILDPAPAQALPAEMLALVDILTPNESEACLLLGSSPRPIHVDDAPAIAASLQSLGPRHVVLKLGEKGCYALTPDGSQHSPGFPVQAVDTTAAGDTFNAALAVALAEHQPWPQALRFANAAAALSVTRLGAQASIPSRPEVDNLL